MATTTFGPVFAFVNIGLSCWKYLGNTISGSLKSLLVTNQLLCAFAIIAANYSSLIDLFQLQYCLHTQGL